MASQAYEKQKRGQESKGSGGVINEREKKK